uniref:Ras-GEF domain-containing protein n=1 Tax=Romanomermis culicivorax TaxID=13658 RepID=A0A915HQP6_ROMCU
MCLITFPVNRPSSSPDINNVKTCAGQPREKDLSETLANAGGTIAVVDNGQNVACSINSHKKQMKGECHSSSSLDSSSTDRPYYMPFSRMTKQLQNDGRPLPPLPYAVKFRDQAARSCADRDSGIWHSGRIPENLDVDEDYHEYCDIDYEEPKLPSRVVFRTAPPQIVGQKSETSHGRPSLPPRHPADIFLRDSACVADVSLYDTPKMKHPRLSFNFRSRIDRSGNFEHPALPAKELFSTSAFHRKIVDEILKIDVQNFVDILNESDRHFLGFCSEINRNNMNLSHFDLILLPIGRQLRSDVLERSKLWSKFLVYCLTEILSDDKVGRVHFLAKWINIAKIAESQNLYAYGYILAALESKEVLSLTQCWQEFRVMHTDLALAYETQLKPKLLENQRNTVSHCSNYIIPDVEPMARLLNAETKLDTWLYQWEDLDPLFGI